MSIIEQRINKNKKVFDTHEPDAGHFDRFESKLKELHPERKRPAKKMFPILTKVAAVALVLVIISMLVFNVPAFLSEELSEETDMELLELQNYYASNNIDKYNEINKIVGDDDEIKLLKEKAMRKVNRLEDNTQKLQEEYIESNKDKRVFSAIVGNYKLLSTALDKIIESMNNVKSKKTSY